MEDAENDDDVKVIFNVDEAAELLFATGFRKAVCSLGLQHVSLIKSSLIDYHCLLKVKAEMDQFLEGLSLFGMLDAIRKKPEVMKPLFMAQTSNKVSAGNRNNCIKICLLLCRYEVGDLVI